MIEQIQNDQSPEARLKRVEAQLEYAHKQLRDETRVIDVLVAVGKLARADVDEARALVSSLSD